MATCMQKDDVYSLAPASDTHRWILAVVMLVTVAFGWKWPVLGFTVPVAMMAGVAGSLLRGRYVCGNICPRGSFYDTFYRFVGGNRPVPPQLKSMRFRWAMVAILMTSVALQKAQDPTDPMHWGMVFLQVCAVTTAVGVVLGRIYSARTWCSFCPVGTVANAIGGEKDRLQIGSNCRSCSVCERACPMDLSIASHKSDGVLPHRDCLKCSSCVDSCKVGALSFAGR